MTASPPPTASADAQPPLALRAFSRGLGWLTLLAQALSAMGILLCLVLIGWAVVMRYVFNQPPVWVDEVVGFTLVAVVLLGAAESMRRGEHIGVDLLLTRLGAAGRRRVALWVGVATFVASVILVVNGIDTIAFARMLGLLSEGHLEWPLWILMLLLPVGGALLAAAAIEVFWRAWLHLPPLPSSHGDGMVAGPTALDAVPDPDPGPPGAPRR